ncbi:unnamed protein product, partial [Cladocopium goreaui]
DPKNIGSRPHVRGSRASNPRASRASRASRSSRATRGSLASHASSPVRASAASAGTRETPSSSATGKSARTGRTAMTGRGSVVSAFSRVTALSEAGQDFSHHYLTSNLLQPEIVGASGKKRKVRLPVEDEDTEDGPEENPTPAKSGGIPSDIRLPASLIVLCSLCNNSSYSIEFSTFAIYFKEVHNWNEATLAGLAQTAGDLMAAIAMQVIPVFVSDNYDPDELDCFRRYLHYVTSMPYNLSLIVFTWVLFNGGLVTPILPLAITAQVLMGTTYVYSSKWTTDMNLFYSLGDPKLFLNLQVLCRNADAVGGTIGGVLGNFLYTVDPVGPFIFTCGLACVVFVIVTVGFCARLGFGDDIETAEEKRSRRLGKRRVSSWASAGRKSTTQNL